LVHGFTRAQARLLPADPVPTYAFTTSALDDTLAPAGRHTMYLACPCAPFTVEGGSERAAEAVATNYYQRGGLPEAIEQLERVLKRDDLDYYDRARISAQLDRWRVERLRERER
ncbi:MAG: hypothetical protein R3323_00365, partial [Wenzhouxiangellaceae bacterium]|nr:hypothetical protein [Wenzhouxiangellaceae bacterium]